MELEEELQREFVDLMSRATQVIPQSPPPQAVDLAPREKRDVVLLNDDLIIDVYNLSCDEFQKRIVKQRRNNFLDDHAKPTFIRERMIV